MSDPSGSPVSLSFIDGLYVSNVECPLRDHFVNPPKIWFSPGESPVCPPAGSAAKATPVAIYRDTAFRVALAESSLESIQALTSPLALVGKAGEWIVFNSQNKQTVQDLVKDLVVNQPSVNGTAKPLPWALTSDITWTLSGSDPEQPIYTCDTKAEVYVFPPNLPKYIVQNGLPVQLMSLDSLWPSWMRSKATDWPAFVVDAIFNDPHLEYETWGGYSKYTSGVIEGLASHLANDWGMELWLDLWLNDVMGPNEVKTQMNCYDLGCLVQVLVSLGTDSVAKKVRVKYMDPYGFIKPAKLIGRVDSRRDSSTGELVNPENLCNNPFYGSGTYAKEMKCRDDDKHRSPFNNHLFVTIEKEGEPHVLDACCGPQVGKVKLVDYPASAIDPRSDKKNGYPGQLFNITDGVGVKHLVVSHVLNRTSPASGSDLLIDRVILLDPGKWNAPFFASPAQNYSISASWTLFPGAHPGKRINIDVFRYHNDNKDYLASNVQNAYDMRVSTVKDYWFADASDEGKSDGITGSIRIFCNTSLGYVAVIRSAELNTNDTAPLKTQLKSLLNLSMTPPKQEEVDADETEKMEPEKKGIKTIKMDKNLPIKVNESFNITVTPTVKANQLWRGYTIKVPRGNALFLEVQQMPDNTVVFNFLARSAGFERITISMYDGNLEVDTKSINVWLHE